jgi:hypothetical protein
VAVPVDSSRATRLRPAKSTSFKAISRSFMAWIFMQSDA